MRVGSAFPLAAALAVTAALACPIGAAAKTHSEIVYQCGNGEQICLIDPSGGSPRTLAQTGDLAGVTADGTTYGYAIGAGDINGGGIWEAPVAGGTPTEVNHGDTGTSTPVMSPNGQFFIFDLDDLELGDFITEYGVAAGPSSSPIDIDYDDVPPVSYGWLGTTPLTAHYDGSSWVCIGGQTQDVDSDGIGSCGANDPTALIQSSTNNIVYPSGSSDGTQIVATVAPADDFGGSIALYSASTGAFIRTIATPPSGSEYTQPHFSPDGTQVVFESDPTGNGPSSIDIVNVDGGGLTTVATGTSPFWGRAPATAPPTPLPPAARVSLTVPHQHLAGARRHRRLTASCELVGAGRCTVTATITAKLAKRLTFKVAKKAQTYTLARTGRTLKKKGTVVLTLTLSATQVRALRRVTSLRLTVTATSTSAGHRARTASKRITLR